MTLSVVITASFDERVDVFIDAYGCLPDGEDVVVSRAARCTVGEMESEEAAIVFEFGGKYYPFSTEEARCIAHRLDHVVEVTPELEPGTVETLRHLAWVLRTSADNAESHNAESGRTRH